MMNRNFNNRLLISTIIDYWQTTLFIEADFYSRFVYSSSCVSPNVQTSLKQLQNVLSCKESDES